MLSKGVKTSELYILIALILVWGIDYLNIDVAAIALYLSQTTTAAADVQDQVAQMKEPKGSAGYYLGWTYIVARTFLKHFKGGTANEAKPPVG